jgi:hypothetical protein
MGRMSCTIPNRVSGQDSLAQGICSAITAKYPALGVQIPATQPLVTELDLSGSTWFADLKTQGWQVAVGKLPPAPRR